MDLLIPLCNSEIVWVIVSVGFIPLLMLSVLGKEKFAERWKTPITCFAMIGCILIWCVICAAVRQSMVSGK